MSYFYICGSAGVVKRGRLKICWLSAYEGSNPFSRIFDRGPRSSVGLEQFPPKEQVAGSNPVEGIIVKFLIPFLFIKIRNHSRLQCDPQPIIQQKIRLNQSEKGERSPFKRKEGSIRETSLICPCIKGIGQAISLIFLDTYHE